MFSHLTLAGAAKGQKEGGGQEGGQEQEGVSNPYCGNGNRDTLQVKVQTRGGGQPGGGGPVVALYDSGELSKKRARAYLSGKGRYFYLAVERSNCGAPSCLPICKGSCLTVAKYPCICPLCPSPFPPNLVTVTLLDS